MGNQGQSSEMKVKDRKKSKIMQIEDKVPSSDDSKQAKQNDEEQNKTKNNKPIRKTGKVQAMEGHKLSQMAEDTNQSNSTAEALNFEHQISVDAKKKQKKKR